MLGSHLPITALKGARAKRVPELSSIAAVLATLARSRPHQTEAKTLANIKFFHLHFGPIRARHVDAGTAQAVRTGTRKLFRKDIHTAEPTSDLYDIENDIAENNEIAST